jgi:hypothetical protein
MKMLFLTKCYTTRLAKTEFKIIYKWPQNACYKGKIQPQ